MTEQDKEKEYENAIQEYGGIITGICYYFSSNTEEFKDLRQEVFYHIWKGWDKFRKDCKLSTWIYRVCFNTCVSYKRKDYKRQNTISIEKILNIPDIHDSSEIDKYNTMHSLIQKLNFQDRALILLWLDEKTYDEIAELMGLTRNNVAVKLLRIKEKLKILAGNE